VILMLFHDFADLDESTQYWFMLQTIYTMDLTHELIQTNSSFGFVGFNKLIRKIHGIYNTYWIGSDLTVLYSHNIAFFFCMLWYYICIMPPIIVIIEFDFFALYGSINLVIKYIPFYSIRTHRKKIDKCRNIYTI
jgi:hypothetical protein